jgi:hypothetical protein
MPAPTPKPDSILNAMSYSFFFYALPIFLSLLVFTPIFRFAELFRLFGLLFEFFFLPLLKVLLFFFNKIALAFFFGVSKLGDYFLLRTGYNVSFSYILGVFIISPLKCYNFILF